MNGASTTLQNTCKSHRKVRCPAKKLSNGIRLSPWLELKCKLELGEVLSMFKQVTILTLLVGIHELLRTSNYSYDRLEYVLKHKS